MYQWQRAHIFRDLLSHNCNITVFNPLEFRSTDEANEKLIMHINSVCYDLFMTPHTEKDLYIDTLSQIKRKSIPTLLICFDNLTVPYNHKNICKFFDLVWLTSYETKYMFDKWGANSIFLPYAANPDLCDIGITSDIPKVLFIGTVYGSRACMINGLLKKNIPVTLHTAQQVRNAHKVKSDVNYKELLESGINMLSYPIGRKLLYASIKNKLLKQSVLDFDNSNLEINSSLPFMQMMETYPKYALSLASMSNRHTGILKKPVNIVNLRSFEIPAAGGLQFCSYNKELAEYFEQDKEAIYYLNENEMIEKALFYLDPKREKLRFKMKRAAKMRARNEHTWFCRFKKVFERLGIVYTV